MNKTDQDSTEDRHREKLLWLLRNGLDHDEIMDLVREIGLPELGRLLATFTEEDLTT